jgi:uncharacterized protein involved in exopolysaccharide biosynthesis
MSGAGLPPFEEGRANLARHTTAREFLAVLFRRRWIVIGLFIVTTLTVAVVTLSQKADYVSSGQVLLKRGEQESVMTPTRRVMGLWEEELGSEVQLIKSYAVLQLAAKKLAEQAPPGAPVPPITPAEVDAEAVGKSNVLAIAYADADPKTAQQVCNAVIAAYLEFREKDMALAYPRQFFDAEITKVQKELDYWVEERRKYTNNQDISDIDEQQRSLVAELSSLKLTRSNEAAGLAEAETMQREMHALRDDPEVDMPTFGQMNTNEQVLVELKRRVIEQEARVATLRERFRDGATFVVTAQQTLDTLKVMLASEVESRLKITDARVQVIRSRLDIYDREIASINDRLARIPDEQARLGDMNRRIDLLRKRVEDLTEKSDLAQVNEKTTTSTDLFLIAPAGPAVPRHTRDYVRLALAPAFSLVVGIGLAFFVDGLDLTVHTSGHAEEAVELPVLAAVGERRRTGAR